MSWKLNIHAIDKFLANGATFMTGFFVLSGFVMAHVYANTDFTSRSEIYNYYLKRFAKIYPLYLISTIIFFSIFRDYSIIDYSKVIINDIFLSQGFFKSIFAIGANGGTWSLSVEMFLYFLFPFLCILLNKNGSIAVIVGILMAFIISMNILLNPNTTDHIYSNPVLRVPDFLIGMGFYFIRENKIFNNLSHILIVPALFAVCIFLGAGESQYCMGQFLIASMFGVWIACVSHCNSKIYNNQIVVFLGTISYSFYIWQFTSIGFARILKEHYGFHGHFIMLSSLLLNIIIAYLSYKWIEEPCRKAIINRAFAKSKRITTYKTIPDHAQNPLA